MVDPVHDDDLAVIVDLVGPCSRLAGYSPRQLANQRLADASRVPGHGARDGLDRRVADLVGSWLRCRSPSRMISTSNTRPCLHLVAQGTVSPVAGLPAGSAQELHQLVVLEDVEHLLQRRQVIGANQDEGESSVAGDQDPVALTLKPGPRPRRGAP
jgi:hypothetical protein